MWPFGTKKTLNNHLFGTKKVKIKGIIFEIKKIDPTDYVTGVNVMTKNHDIYENKKSNESDVKVDEKAFEKVKKYYRDLLTTAVVDPVLTRKDEGGSTIQVDNMFTDWELVEELSGEILSFCYGKKKA